MLPRIEASETLHMAQAAEIGADKHAVAMGKMKPWYLHRKLDGLEKAVRGGAARRAPRATPDMLRAIGINVVDTTPPTAPAGAAPHDDSTGGGSV